MIKFIKKYKVQLIISGIFPIIFPYVFGLLILILPGNQVGSEDGWLSFLGGYTGGIIALIGIAWQIEHSKISDKKKRTNKLL